MRAQMYKENTANYPRLKTDVFFSDYDNAYRYDGFIDKAIRYIDEFQLTDEALWTRFAEQYRMEDADCDDGWRGEYWGKMMRGACFTYSYTQNEKLYQILTHTVLDVLACQESDGRISTYKKDHEFHNWDMWGRKYVLLGMQYFLEICKDDELKAEIIESMRKQVDYIMNFVGDGSGQTEITQTSAYWRGLNSSSFLEPVVRLYSITKEKKYFDFAAHIVNCGGIDIENIFQLAYEDNLYPYQYPVTKAYEMISCFEGLLEYYRVTGEEKYKIAVVNFANKLLESDVTIIGSSGCTHELFDNSSVRQANTTNGPSQETCVTVTLMKFMYQLTLLTGDARYADVFEASLYNAYLGSFNTSKAIEGVIDSELPGCIKEPLPFGSYSPLTAGTRGNLVGGLKLMSDNHYYGCCACIGSAGNGMIPKMALMSSKNGFAMNLFMNGITETVTPENNSITFVTETDYPVSGNIKITLKMKKSEAFELLIRNPGWSTETAAEINGEKISAANGGYIRMERAWNDGDVIFVRLDMKTRAVYPTPYGNRILMTKAVLKTDFYVVPVYDTEDSSAKNHVALLRGPIVLAQDNRLGYSVDEPVSIEIVDGCVDAKLLDGEKIPFESILAVEVPLANGKAMKLTDYSSAGKTWDDNSKMAAWILTK